MRCIYCEKEVTKETQGFEGCTDVCKECAIDMVGIDETDIS